MKREREGGEFEVLDMALGGHRTSHTKPNFNANGPPTKSKAHECPICGLDFPIGQALGGHMRRHRNTAAAAVLKKSDGCGKRVFELDLNLPPLENNLNLKLQLSL
ncbi:zinc finger protein ZAT12-like isoform X2 [Cucurbita moschata]|uniref:Zinc finger protein ZAT12-like isoform X2 n=1 Tax=Cucurbita moschata TaxID=3662 RepID=A0A6J1GAT3_CUCMO|nr:zinc finger protein ZAT12-like isoform X2 [Cucurbita moschata]